MEAQIETTGETALASSIDTQRIVKVTIDGVPQKIRSGEYIVSKLKAVLKVDADKELDLVVHGELKPLCDDDQITVKEGMAFVSHTRTGCSS